MPTPEFPKFPTLPSGCGMRNAARLKCGWSANGTLGSTGVLHEQRLTRQLAASGGGIDEEAPRSGLGFVLAMPVDCSTPQLGVTAWPLNSRVDAGDLPVAQVVLHDGHRR